MKQETPENLIVDCCNISTLIKSYVDNSADSEETAVLSTAVNIMHTKLDYLYILILDSEKEL